MNGIEQRYLKAIRNRVCHYCEHLTADQVCGLADRVCPVERNLQEIVHIIHHVQNQPVESYLFQLHRVICAACENEDLSGHCTLRASLDCALDRYFDLVVDAIDSVRHDLRQQWQTPIHT